MADTTAQAPQSSSNLAQEYNLSPKDIILQNFLYDAQQKGLSDSQTKSLYAGIDSGAYDWTKVYDRDLGVSRYHSGNEMADGRWSSYKGESLNPAITSLQNPPTGSTTYLQNPNQQTLLQQDNAARQAQGIPLPNIAGEQGTTSLVANKAGGQIAVFTPATQQALFFQQEQQAANAPGSVGGYSTPTGYNSFSVVPSSQNVLGEGWGAGPLLPSIGLASVGAPAINLQGAKLDTQIPETVFYSPNYSATSFYASKPVEWPEMKLFGVAPLALPKSVADNQVVGNLLPVVAGPLASPAIQNALFQEGTPKIAQDIPILATPLQMARGGVKTGLELAVLGGAGEVVGGSSLFVGAASKVPAPVLEGLGQAVSGGFKVIGLASAVESVKPAASLMAQAKPLTPEAARGLGAGLVLGGASIGPDVLRIGDAANKQFQTLVFNNNEPARGTFPRLVYSKETGVAFMKGEMDSLSAPNFGNTAYSYKTPYVPQPSLAQGVKSPGLSGLADLGEAPERGTPLFASDVNLVPGFAKAGYKSPFAPSEGVGLQIGSPVLEPGEGIKPVKIIGTSLFTPTPLSKTFYPGYLDASAQASSSGNGYAQNVLTSSKIAGIGGQRSFSYSPAGYDAVMEPPFGLISLTTTVPPTQLMKTRTKENELSITKPEYSLLPTQEIQSRSLIIPKTTTFKAIEFPQFQATALKQDTITAQKQYSGVQGQTVATQILIDTPLAKNPSPKPVDTPPLPKIAGPPLLFGGLSGGGFPSFTGFTKSGRQQKKYMPSLSAALFGIKGKAPGATTGIEIRPLLGVGGFKKMKFPKFPKNIFSTKRRKR